MTDVRQGEERGGPALPGLARRTLALAVTLLALAAAPLAPAQATIRAVVVGIDNYRHPDVLPPLRGALNDARDLAETFRGLGVTDLTVLLEKDAHRAAVLGAWEAVLERGEPGDVIFLTYAGHGMRVRAPAGSSEEDGMDEFYPLYGFSGRSAGVPDLILDNEIFYWAKRAEARGLRVVLVTDACHSGSPFRSIDQRITGIKYRFAGVSIEEDMLEGLEVSEDDETSELPPDFMSFGAALDSQKVAELLLPDRTHGLEYRGALSYFLSRGLQGAADDDQDGLVGFDELKRYVVRNIQFRTNTQQNPVVIAGQLSSQGLVDLSGAAGVPPARPPGPVRLTILNRGGASVPELEGVVLIPPGNQVDLIWDVDHAEVVSGLDTVIARNVGNGNVQGVIDRQRARDRLASIAERKALDITLTPVQPTHREGERLTLEVDGLHYRHLLLLNLASDGRTQFIYPLDAYEARALDQNRPFHLPGLDVTGPFGADLLVAITVDQPQPDLIAALGRLSDRAAADGRANALDAVGQIETSLRGTGFRIGIHAFYSCERGDPKC